MSENKIELRNYAVIEGILSENALEKAEFKGENVIRGHIVIKVTDSLTKDGAVEDMFIPVSFFSKEHTKKGGKNPSYASLENFMTNAVSIAAAGEEQASCVSVTNASVSERAFYGRDGKLISNPELRGSFINIIRKEQMNMRAVADIEGIITNMKHEIDNEGIETGVFNIQLMLVGFNEYSEIVDVKVLNPAYVSAIEAAYDIGMPMTTGVKLHFSTEKKKILEEVAIGEPMERTITINIKELVLVNAKPSNAAELINADVIARLKQSRLDRLAEAKARQEEAKTTEKPSTAPSRANLGFDAF